ncbi:MAG: aminopeptidase P family protein [Proteobacteria bacterium]|nr:aminopeptidase P family protein [Pseudomonadota bacterium]MDA1057639.1 aminopeptidase P family protein [Pseudomonadota bacterium]
MSDLSAKRLTALRGELKEQNLDGFLVPLQDEHQGEWIPPHAQRLAWLTGFTGSAGIAVVLADQAAIFVDGRYTLQVRQQVDAEAFVPHHLMDDPPTKWVATHLAKGRLGYDPWLHTPTDVERFEKACLEAGGTLHACEVNPLDIVWTDRPGPPRVAANAYPTELAGEASASKRARIGQGLRDRKIDVAVLTAPDSIAWLLNIRGGDLEYTPVTLSFALLHDDSRVDWFVDLSKVSDELAASLGNEVIVMPPGELGPALTFLGAHHRRVQIDPASTASWIDATLRQAGAVVSRAPDPCLLPKACKNDVELAGMRGAHVRDGAALTRFLAWLPGAVAGGGIDEIGAADRLEEFRRESNMFTGLSFPTIAGTGPNGAIVHYRAMPGSARQLGDGDVLLIDSGAQYRDGTTDVTRTIALGAATAEQRDRFTRVLKGHIALARATFVEGTSGSQIDILARAPLWEAGLDFDHGTGHGVGAHLNVHEGPHRISKMPNREALRPGMIVSNEPGYYKEGAFGIRIENLVAVREATPIDGQERKRLELETLTLAPIDRHLIEPSLMTEPELAWLDAYHARVRDTLTPLVDAATGAWLAAATAPVRKSA